MNLKEQLGSFAGKASCLIYDLDAGKEIFSYDKDARVVSASTIKVGILLSVLNRLKMEGRSPKDSFLSMSATDILPDSEVFEYGPGEVSVYELLYWMITNSDNTATNVLISYMGYDAINDYLCSLGLSSSRTERKMLDWEAVRAGKNNYTSAADLLLMFRKVLELSENGENTALDILKENRDDTLLRRYLYEGYPFAHKSGQLDDVLHDAGVIFDSCGRLFMAVCLTEFPPDKMHEAEKLIGRIARAVEDERKLSQ